MAGRSSLAAKRRFSLEVGAASKPSDNIIHTWSTASSSQHNGVFDIVNGRFKDPESDKSSSYIRKNITDNGIRKQEESNSKDSQLEQNESEDQKKWFTKFVSWRYFMVLLLQSSYVVSQFLKNCLPMAMVCMVKPVRVSSSFPSHTNGTSGSSNSTINETDDGVERLKGQEPVFENVSYYPNNTDIEDTGYEFAWSSEVQGLLLTSAMFSTFLGPVLASIIREHMGSKTTMSLTNIVSTCLTFLSPLAARISPYCFMAIRILLGISLGGNISVVGDSLAWWAPHEEKLVMISLTFSGINIGFVLTSLLSGYLCLIPLDNGWPFIFYTFGVVSFVWGICWHFLSAHKPEEHPYISEKEKLYIISHRIGMDSPKGGKKVKLPYQKLLTSTPVLAYFACGICLMWTTQVLFAYLPVFFNKFLKFSVQETGLLTSLTASFRMFGSFLWAALGNKLMSLFGTNRSRKICICLGFGLAGVSTILVGFFDESYKWVALGLLIFVMLNQSVRSSTIAALPLDMAPRYAGLLSGMNVSIANIVSISGPLLTASIIANGTRDEWRIVWIIIGTILITAAIIFLIFGQAVLQPWALGLPTDNPHILSHFVAMGRRFSTLVEAPALSPVTLRKHGADFARDLQIQSTNDLAQMASVNPEIFYGANFDFEKMSLPEVIVEPSEQIDDFDTHENKMDSNHEGNGDDQISQVKKRAFSEFGLEVLKRNTNNINSDEDESKGQSSSVSRFRGLEGMSRNSPDEEIGQVSCTGIVNDGFEVDEEQPARYSENAIVSRL